MVHRRIIGEYSNSPQQVDCQCLVLRVAATTGAAQQGRQEGDERPHIDHFDAKGLIESDFGEQTYQLGNVADDVYVVPTSFQLHRALHDPEQVVGDAEFLRNIEVLVLWTF